MKIWYVVCFFLIAGAWSSQAGEKQAYKATILLITWPLKANSQQAAAREAAEPTYAEEGQKLHRLIDNSIKLTLEQAGLQVVLTSELADTVSNQPKLKKEVTLDTASIFRLANQVQADFTLTGSFVGRNKEVELYLNWYNVHQSSRTQTKHKKLSLQLSFDAAVSQAVGEVLSETKQEIARVIPFKKRAVNAVDHTLPRETAQPTSAVKREFLPDDRQESASDDTAVTAASLPEQKERAAYLGIITGFAPFLAIGEVSDYFKMSYTPTLSLSCLINLPPGQLGLGVYAGLNIFQVDEIEDSGMNYFLPLGADLRFETHTRPLRFYVHLAGGPTLLTINLDNTTPRSKVIAFVLGGIGLCVPFNTHVGLALDSSFIVFFDDTTLMGYMPCGAFYIKL